MHELKIYLSVHLHTLISAQISVYIMDLLWLINVVNK